MENNFAIYQIERELSLLQEVSNLVWEVFSEFEAPEYDKEGIDEFKGYIHPFELNRMCSLDELIIWGCDKGGEMAGVIAAAIPDHISLFFVKKAYHRQGMGKALFNTAYKQLKQEYAVEKLTVNSSPYAVEVYKKLGFEKMREKQKVNGISFIPMELNCSSRYL